MIKFVKIGLNTVCCNTGGENPNEVQLSVSRGWEDKPVVTQLSTALYLHFNTTHSLTMLNKPRQIS